MEAWKIHRDRSACKRPGCPLPTASEYFAVLELPACQRRDLCATCFQQLEQQGQAQPIYWKARRKEGERRGPTLDLVSLRVLFDRLGEVEGDQAQSLRYFVALLLLRKRVLKMVDAKTAEQERADLVVVDPKVEGMQPVALFAPELDTERMAGLKDELLAALDETQEESPIEA